MPGLLGLPGLEVKERPESEICGAGGGCWGSTSERACRLARSPASTRPADARMSRPGGAHLSPTPRLDEGQPISSWSFPPRAAQEPRAPLGRRARTCVLLSRALRAAMFWRMELTLSVLSPTTGSAASSRPGEERMPNTDLTAFMAALLLEPWRGCRRSRCYARDSPGSSGPARRRRPLAGRARRRRTACAVVGGGGCGGSGSVASCQTIQATGELAVARCAAECRGGMRGVVGLSGCWDRNAAGGRINTVMLGCVSLQA